jgi:hypothetical protein
MGEEEVEEGEYGDEGEMGEDPYYNEYDMAEQSYS